MTEAAEKLDYHLPKQRIRRSAKSRKLLVVFCPTLTNPYYVMLLQGIEAMAKEYGYGVFVCNTQRDLKIEENYLRMMREVQPLESSMPVTQVSAARWQNCPERSRWL